MCWCGKHLNQSELSSDESKAGLLVSCGSVSSQSLRELFRSPSCHPLRSLLVFPGLPLKLCFFLTRLWERGHHLPAWQDLRHSCTHVVLPSEGSLELAPYIPMQLFSLYTVVLMILSTHWQSSNHGTRQLVHKDDQLLLLFHGLTH